MSFNLIEAAKGLFNNELIGKASSLLGESDNAVSKALGGIIPSLLGGLIDKTSGSEGAATVAQLAKETNEQGIAGNLAGLLGDTDGLLAKGAGLLSGLFGKDAASLLSNVIAQFSGVKNSSAGSLLSMAAPAVLGMLGNHAKNNNLDAAGMGSLLSSQKDSIAAALPAGLNLGSVFSGFGSQPAQAAAAISDAAHTKASHDHHAPHHGHEAEVENSGALKYILPLIMMALIAMACWYLVKDGCRSSNHGPTPVAGTTTGSHDAHGSNTGTVSMPAVAGKVDSLTGDFIYDLGESIELSLPDGAKLSVGKNSTEYKLIQFLNDKNATLDSVKGNWFEFTNVRFKTGGAEITAESEAQLKNMVAIAKAFPNAKFKVGGYTDNTGDAAKNLALSQKRADAVAAKVKALGIAGGAITGAEGFGKEWPIASNDTPEGRAQNRRVAVNVKAK